MCLSISSKCQVLDVKTEPVVTLTDQPWATYLEHPISDSSILENGARRVGTHSATCWALVVGEEGGSWMRWGGP